MAIEIGAPLPDVTFRLMGADGVLTQNTAELFKGKRVVLFAVPGAFTPTCHQNHLPSYIKNYDALLNKGLDGVYVTAVNDVFVMNAWKKASEGADKIVFLSDGNGDFAQGVDLTLDGTAFGLGVRSQRYAMIVRDGVVENLFVEENPGQANVSSAEEVLKNI